MLTDGFGQDQFFHIPRLRVHLEFGSEATGALKTRNIQVNSAPADEV
jgi:hypothetical protein